MKKLCIVFLVLALFVVCVGAAGAADMGVLVIGGPNSETEPVSLDDIKMNAEVKIDGYAILCPREFGFFDRLGYYRAGRTGVVNSDDYFLSGAEAEYAILRVDLTNLATASRDFLASCEATVVFDDAYTYSGWFYQSDYNNSPSPSKSNSSREWYAEDFEKQNMRWVINESDQFEIDPMYQGHYVFGAALPNAVVNAKESLRMVITIDGNEITYNIRK